MKLLRLTGSKRQRLVIHQAENSQTTNHEVLLIIASRI